MVEPVIRRAPTFSCEGSMKLRSLLPVALLVLGACASGAGSALYRREVGSGSGRDAMIIIQRVAELHSYRIENVDTLRDIRVETDWVKRPPFEDEAALGIEDA